MISREFLYTALISFIVTLTPFCVLAEEYRCSDDFNCLEDSLDIETSLGTVKIPTAAKGMMCGDDLGSRVSTCVPRLLGLPIPDGEIFTYLDIDANEPIIIGPFTGMIPLEGKYAVTIGEELEDVLRARVLRSTVAIAWDVPVSSPIQVSGLGISPRDEFEFRVAPIRPAITGEIRNWMHDFNGNMYMRGKYDMTGLLKRIIKSDSKHVPKVYLDGYSIGSAVLDANSPVADEIAALGDLKMKMSILSFLQPYEAKIGQATLYASNVSGERYLAFQGTMDSQEFTKILPFVDTFSPKGSVEVDAISNFSDPTESYLEAYGDFKLPGNAGSIENAVFRADSTGFTVTGEAKLAGVSIANAVAVLKTSGVEITVNFGQKIPGLAGKAVACGFGLARDVAKCGAQATYQVTSAALCGGYESFKCGVKVLTSILHCGVALFSGKPKKCSVDIKCNRPKSCTKSIPKTCMDVSNPITCRGDVKFNGYVRFKVDSGGANSKVGGSICVDGSCGRVGAGASYDAGKVCFKPGVFNVPPLDLLGVNNTQCIDVGKIFAARTSRSRSSSGVANFGVEESDDFEVEPLSLATGWLTGEDLKKDFSDSDAAHQGVYHASRYDFAPASVIHVGSTCMLTGMIGIDEGKFVEGTPIATLPPSCRPKGILIVSANQYDQVTRLNILPNGEIKYGSGNTDFPWITLDGIVIDAGETAAIQFNPEAWGNYSKSSFARPSVARMGGLCMLSGLVGSKNKPINTRDEGKKFLGSVPSYCAPNGRLSFSTNHNNHTMQIDIEATGKISVEATDGGSDWASLAGIAYSPEMGELLDPAPGWVNYVDSVKKQSAASFRPLSLLKDGHLCMLSGYLKASTPITFADDNREDTLNNEIESDGILLATLPEYCRPNYRHAFNTNNFNLSARVDVWPNGEVRWMGGGLQHDSVSLSGINFLVPTDSQPELQFVMQRPWNAYLLNTKWPKLEKQNDVCLLSGTVRLIQTSGDRNQFITGNGVDERTIGYIKDPQCFPSHRKSFFLNQSDFGAQVDVFENGEVRWSGGYKFPISQKSILETKRRPFSNSPVADYYENFRDAIEGLESLPRDEKPWLFETPWVTASYSHEDGAQFRSPLPAFLNLNGIAYTVEKEESLGVSFEGGTTVPLSSDYAPLTQHGHSIPIYNREGSLCFLSGRIKRKPFPGALHTIANIDNIHGTIGTLPTECRPSKKLIFATNLNEVPSRIDISPNGVIEWKTGVAVPGHVIRGWPTFQYANTTDWIRDQHFLNGLGSRNYDIRNRYRSYEFWVDLDGIAFPVDGGEELTLAPGASHYGGAYGSASVVKEGKICIVSGLLKASIPTDTTPKHIATLPEWCRPTRTTIVNGSQSRDIARLDIAPDGRILGRLRNPRASSYISLSNILFTVEEEGKR
ncbi:MAG: hypothetical protein KDD70_12580 [Bdellovibrionales bacterium]|nr:hypothetical protein [Bdellovibrionales bacterium]